jgi:hypothetical protein
VASKPFRAMVVFLRCLVYVAALRRADPTSEESYRLSVTLRNGIETAFHGFPMLQRERQKLNKNNNKEKSVRMISTILDYDK